MRKQLVLGVVLSVSMLAFAQHGNGGGGMGHAGGMGNAGGGMGMPSNAGGRPDWSGPGAGGARSGGHDARGQQEMQQHRHVMDAPVTDQTKRSGAWKMLEKKTGLTSDQLQALYGTSGAKNFGQFASAIVVSKNLNLDYNKIFTAEQGGKSLGQALQDLGVSKKDAKNAQQSAKKQLEQADAKSSDASGSKG